MNKYSVRKVMTTKGQEGFGYTCDVLKDGKKIGVAENYGDGGPTQFFDFTKSDLKDLDDYAASLPKIEAYGMKLSRDRGSVVAALADAVCPVTKAQWEA